LLEQGVQRVGADSVQGIELGAGHLHAASLPANGPPEQLPRLHTFEGFRFHRFIPMVRTLSTNVRCFAGLYVNSLKNTMQG
jgi:hypothetical protein